MEKLRQSKALAFLGTKRLILLTMAALPMVLGLLRPFQTAPTPVAKGRIAKRPRLIAHRGLSTWAPENTLAAILMAVEEGCDLVELDVHLSRDGYPVVIHDDCVSRTTNYGAPRPVGTFTLTELKGLDAGSWFHPRFSGQRIPSLEEVLLLPKKGTGLMIELKAQDVPPRYLVERVVDTVRGTLDTPIPVNVFVGSLNPLIVRELVRQAPDFSIVGIAENQKAITEYLSLGLKHIALKDCLANQTALKKLKKHEVEVWAWTVDRERTARKLARAGVSGIISNDPANLGWILR